MHIRRVGGCALVNRLKVVRRLGAPSLLVVVQVGSEFFAFVILDPFLFLIIDFVFNIVSYPSRRVFLLSL